MKERPKCIIDGCHNNVRSKGKNEDGTTRLTKTCRKHYATGEKRYRHRGKKTTLSARAKFGKTLGRYI